MIVDVHSAIQHLLFHRGLIPSDEVDVRFERPTKEWVDSLVRPTVNLYLFDIEENTDLRQSNMPVVRGAGGMATYRMPPRRFDLRYLVSALTTVEDDEYLLIYRVLATLMRYPTLPPASLAAAMAAIAMRDGVEAERARFAALADAGERTTLDELRGAVDAAKIDPATQAAMRALLADPPVSTKISLGEEGPRLLEVWSALEQAPRPSLLYTVTVPVDLEIAIESPLVLTRMLRVRQRTDTAEPPTQIRIGGTVRDRAGIPIAGVRVAVEGSGVESITSSEGRFVLSHVSSGKATLRATRADGATKAMKVDVPSDSYDITLD